LQSLLLEKGIFVGVPIEVQSVPYRPTKYDKIHNL